MLVGTGLSSYYNPTQNAGGETEGSFLSSCPWLPAWLLLDPRKDPVFTSCCKVASITDICWITNSYIQYTMLDAMSEWSRTVVSDSLRPHGLYPIRLLCPWDSPGKSAAVDCHFLLQGIFPTQELNPGLPHCRQTLYRLSHQGRPRNSNWIGLGLHHRNCLVKTVYMHWWHHRPGWEMLLSLFDVFILLFTCTNTIVCSSISTYKQNHCSPVVHIPTSLCLTPAPLCDDFTVTLPPAPNLG